MVKARKAKQKPHETEPLLPVPFRRESLLTLIGLMRDHAGTSNTEAAAFIRDACDKMGRSPGAPDGRITCAFRLGSWRKLSGALQRVGAEGLAVMVEHRVGLALTKSEREAEQAVAFADKAKTDAALKQAADELRAREAAESAA